VDHEADARPERSPRRREEVLGAVQRHEEPVVAWPLAVVVVTVGVGVEAAADVVPEEAEPVELPLVVVEAPVVAVVVVWLAAPLDVVAWDVVAPASVVTAAVVTVVEAVPVASAARDPNVPTPATAATAAPMVRLRSRPTARSRSAGLRRAAVFMAELSLVDPFQTVTTAVARPWAASACG
jgi:hypothetical protein